MNGINNLISTWERQLSLLAQDPEIQSMNPESQRQTIYRFLDLNPVFFSAFVYSVDGRVTSIAFRNRFRGLDARYENSNILNSKSRNLHSTRSTFLRVLQTRSPAITEHVVSSFDQKMILMMVPVFDFVDSRRVIGVVSCSINLEGPEMNEVIKGYPVTGGGVLVLLDEQGSLIAGRGAELPEGLVKIELGKVPAGETTFQPIQFDMGGRPYIGILAKVPMISGFLVSAKPRAEVFSFLNRLLVDLSLVLALALVLAGVFSFAVARALARNVNRLFKGIRDVSEGMVNHRVPVEGDDELAQACSAFNEMVATLEKNRLMDDIWSREWERGKSEPGSKPAGKKTDGGGQPR